MESGSPEAIASVVDANACIASIHACDTETEVEGLAQRLTRYLDLQSFVFSAMFHCGGQEHYRYLFSCASEWIYHYIQKRWYAIDPYTAYALSNPRPILTTDIPLSSPGQRRMLAVANDFGMRTGVIVPAHSVETSWLGALFLVTSEDAEPVQRSLDTHRYLMCALGIELLEWCNARHHANLLAKFDLDDIDDALLRLALANASTGEAACEVGITLSLARWRYARLEQKFEAHSKLRLAQKAIALGILSSKP